MACSLLAGLLAGNVMLLGIIFVVELLILWIFYQRQLSAILFIAIVALSVLFKLKLIPGFQPYRFTPKFAVGLEGALIGLFPLAFSVPLSKTWQDWKASFKGLAYGCGGILIIAILDILSGVAQWQFKIPSFMPERTFSNLVLTSIPEEGFSEDFCKELSVAPVEKRASWHRGLVEPGSKP